ncbi:MAG: hypothetical protein PHV29_03795 [Candidatus Pacebacteria bacterium]|nr:hypothetical protein [Candidatus Paceibacterota bacterium]MDD2757692.1 hypothetical protein [Candidatus Paceibacterota bacterium]
MNKKIIFIGSILVLLALFGCIFSSGCVTHQNNNYVLQNYYKTTDYVEPGYDNSEISVSFDKLTEKGVLIILMDDVNLTILFDYELNAQGAYFGIPHKAILNDNPCDSLGKLGTYTFTIRDNNTLTAKYKQNWITLTSY